MADETTTTDETTDEVESGATDETTAETGGAESDKDAELARIRAALNKANKEAEKLRLREKEREDAQLSEIEKAKRDAAEASERLAKIERDNLRKSVALEVELPAKWVGRLQGDTEEDLRADALSILADLNRPKKPAPDASQGARTTALSEDDQFFESIYGKG
jgi:hypothetical protein